MGIESRRYLSGVEDIENRKKRQGKHPAFSVPVSQGGNAMVCAVIAWTPIQPADRAKTEKGTLITNVSKLLGQPSRKNRLNMFQRGSQTYFIYFPLSFTIGSSFHGSLLAQDDGSLV
uniref:Uncharacterized protein n=1 Tax=Candidatus Kentrum sp. UNK TaxID=2126344 RepID=A0A451AZG5_9GAMM|nr:MAG: hypothetical protein BECKUNK1418G_GA0071005_106020 [Candidatus Kentron sp. UNK]VFK71410.1 MAG: hypothetical protein BECKUNK1418H_GA0071006_106420 [Candidatus Kentron sp. UNK]